jgi:hypothetical protein
MMRLQRLVGDAQLIDLQAEQSGQAGELRIPVIVSAQSGHRDH